MRKSLFLGAGMMLIATAFAPADLTAQSTGNAAPVPGPYMAMHAPVVPANPYSNQGFAQQMPYWMKPAQQPRGTAPAQAANVASGTVGQQRNNYIPGWAWRPYAPTAGQTNPGRQSTARTNTRRPVAAQGYSQRYLQGYPRGYQQGYMPGRQFVPGYGQQPWPGYGNTPRGANQPRGYGAVRQPQQ